MKFLMPLFLLFTVHNASGQFCQPDTAAEVAKDDYRRIFLEDAKSAQAQYTASVVIGDALMRVFAVQVKSDNASLDWIVILDGNDDCSKITSGRTTTNNSHSWCEESNAAEEGANAYADQYGESPDEFTARFVAEVPVAQSNFKFFSATVDVNGGSGIWAVIMDGNNHCKTFATELTQVD